MFLNKQIDYYKAWRLVSTTTILDIESRGQKYPQDSEQRLLIASTSKIPLNQWTLEIVQHLYASMISKIQ